MAPALRNRGPFLTLATVCVLLGACAARMGQSGADAAIEEVRKSPA